MDDWLSDLENNRFQKKNLDFEVLPTGYPAFDEATGLGGLPKGRIIEIAGPAGVGKTLFSYDLIAKTQQAGDLAVYANLDRGFNGILAKKRGVDLGELFVLEPDSDQMLLTIIKEFIETGSVGLLVIDPISMFVDNGTMDEQIISLLKLIQAYKVTVIFINQVRVNFWRRTTNYTSFMHLMDAYATIRVMMTKVNSIKKDDVLLGKNVKMDIYKNDLSKPTSIEMEIRL